MIPTIISEQVQTGLQDFLRTTFPSKDAFFGPMVEQFISQKDLLFKGPYISIKLPFASSVSKANYFPDVPLGFKPYQHQQKAFQRLREVSARSTIIATGTGSGKTECFLYPVLDYCYHHRGETGIKAIIIYPMNALANDQATRFAKTIHEISHIRNNVTVGLYIGGIDTKSTASVMTENQVITDKSVLRENPPDILLTNYKMLDLLMVREKDSVIWKENSSETLKYIVVDELHTFDGAQGTDLACLIRRLKHRLGTPKNHLCCIGTSATIGGPEDADELRRYASDMFQESFDDESIIMEKIITPAEFLMGHDTDQTKRLFLDDTSLLDSSICSNPEEYIKNQYKIWFDLDVSVGKVSSLTWKKALALKLFSHEIFQRLILALDGLLVTEEDLLQIMEGICKEFLSEQNLQIPSLIKLLTMSLLSLITWARDPSAENAFPFLHVRYQLWLKEMSRLTATVSEHPELLFRDDKPADDEIKDLPVVYCNECGATGWGTSKHDHQNSFSTQLDDFYSNYFNKNTNTYVIYPISKNMKLQQFETTLLCADCLSIVSFNQNTCECGSDHLIKVFLYNPRREYNGGVYGSHDCPFCHAHNSLVIAGRRTSSLISVALSQLYASTFNDDKKVLTFSDSVQDAAHRAGFFEARTWRFNFRIALKHFLDTYNGNLHLQEVGKLFSLWWKTRKSEDDYVATFIPPDMEWLQSYKDFLSGGKGSLSRELVSYIDRRLNWEITSEFGYNAVIGRTLVGTLSATAGLDYQMIETAAQQITERSHEHIGNLELEPEQMQYILIGLLKHMKYKGAIMHPALTDYVNNSCNGYTFSHLHDNRFFMPNLSMSSRLPEFVTIGRNNEVHLNSVETSNRFSGVSWYVWWLTSNLLPDNPHIESYTTALYEIIFSTLVSSGLLRQAYGKHNEEIFGLDPSALEITTDVTAFRCDTCAHTIQVPTSAKHFWTQMPCIQHRCSGTYREIPAGYDYYHNLYAHGDVNRIFSAEHTGLLSREGREELEESFKHHKHLTDPNLLSCTPTLEMGIDIGGLSSAILCSVPPNQANYLQRIGRTGRKDGNSFLLTVASGSSHDQYFYEEPTDMISGNVPAPYIYLDAPAVLERQFVAFCFDSWIRQKSSESIIPRTMDELLRNLQTDSPHLFPNSLFVFIDLHRTELFNDFIDLFDGRLSESAITYLRSFIYGDDQKIQNLEEKIRFSLVQFKKDQDSLITRWKLIRKTIKDMKASAVKDKNYDEELSALQSERAALHSFIKRNRNKELYNFLTDEGLLPNYAFPEAGVLLRSIILSKKVKPDEKGSYYKQTFEYERSAKNAIRELAPDNYFYAEGRKVRIDQIDLNASEVTLWHLCDNCSYAVTEAEMQDTKTCPQCGSQMWSDASRTRSMVRLSQVYATTMDRESRISDDSDSREPVFYNQHILVDINKDDITQSWQIAHKEIPFGFEYVSKATFREINFGPVQNREELMQVNGQEVEANGFKICKECGKVLDMSSQGKGENGILHRHAITCSYRSQPDDREAFMESIFLYREYSSEAVRVLLPVTDLTDEKSIESIIAAIFLGLKKKFGNIDHISSTLTTAPTPNNSDRRTYLVLYDMIPGGTGYLKQLMNDPQEMIDVMQLSLDTMRSCSCNMTEKDGCYRCLLAYRQSRKMNQISRDTAVDIFSKLISAKDAISQVSSLQDITFNKLYDSELEMKFIETLRSSKTIVGKKPVDVKKYLNTPGGNPGWYMIVGNNQYIIEPQVNLELKGKSSHPSKPDFIIYPRKLEQDITQIRPIAIFTDGYQYHRDIVDIDMAKRMSIVQEGSHYIWSITWNDLQKEPSDLRYKQGKKVLKLPQILNTLKVDSHIQIDQNNSFSALLYLLENYHVDTFLRYGFGLSLALCSNQRDQKDYVSLLHLWRDLQLGDQYERMNGDSAIAFYRQALLAEQPFLKHYCFIQKESFASQQFQELYSFLIFDDQLKFNRNEDDICVWHSFLYLYNILQFLPNTKCLTKKGLEASTFWGIPFAEIEATPVYSQYLSELMEITDHEYDELLIALEEDMRPEAFYELESQNGTCIGQADLAWPSFSCALVEEKDQKPWADAGWQIISPTLKPQDIIEMLKERR